MKARTIIKRSEIKSSECAFRIGDTVVLKEDRDSETTFFGGLPMTVSLLRGDKIQFTVCIGANCWHPTKDFKKI